ncbi:hypothetical protein RDV84_17370 [Lysobacter yananisis]|uniref:Uncharacterized protein n=1 Tax=Lysobacter yananisis TaxID=1003114 RepID=A0ABY9P3Y6_9GAMM|nr:hypothetical protein [Lysobacter yananisis]WMT01732.1 hypothetical protein RDV84_17370 [Lysobacter yananisis]
MARDNANDASERIVVCQWMQHERTRLFYELERAAQWRCGIGSGHVRAHARGPRRREKFRGDARGRDSQLRCAGSVTQTRSLRSVVVRKRERDARVCERPCTVHAIGSLSARDTRADAGE